MRVLVTGGRNFDDADLLDDVLDELHRQHGIDCIIHGLARGTDMLGEAWARKRGIEIFAIRANWKKYGKSAGPIRNGELLKQGKPDMVAAFPGGAGTHDMMRQAEKAGVPVKTYPVV